MIKKYGVVNEDSHCDFEPEKKAEYYDEKSDKIASKDNIDKLQTPAKIKSLNG